jgi:photosystem I subunit 3
MKSLLAFLLALTLWFPFAAQASAEDFANLTPCSESPAFQAKAKNFLNTTNDPHSGPEGYPHLIVDGRFSHAGDFLIPSILFLYIAGWIGWVGRAYLIAVRKTKDAEMQEIIINVPLAISKMLGGFLWPLAAVGEFTSGKLVMKDSEVPTSPR